MAATAHQLKQADLFIARLPARPYAVDWVGSGMYVMPKARAITKRHIQPNPPNLTFWMVFDVDQQDAAIRWEDAGLPAPTWIAVNPDNGHAHVAYGLAAPVPRTDAARIAPVRFADAIQRAYTAALGADVNYSGLICKNPLHRDWRVLWYGAGEDDLYSLAELSDYVDLSGYKARRRQASDAGLGRNLAMFDRLRVWAYRAVRDYWRPGGHTHWQAAVVSKAGIYNDFPEPLPSSEVRSIARSVARWVWKTFSPAEFRGKQAARGRRKGAARRAELMPRVVELRAQGLSQAAIAEETGLSERTIMRWLKSASGEGDKAISDIQPPEGGDASKETSKGAP